MSSGDEEEDDGGELGALVRAARPEPADPSDLANRACTDAILKRGGQVVGDYELIEIIGGGAFGEVWKAWSKTLDRAVAVKHLLPRSSDERVRTANAIREAVALGRLKHPNVVTVHGVVTRGDETLIVMELVDGGPLHRWQHDATYDAILDAYLQAGDGLAAIHAAKLLHLDFKPANVLRGDDGRVRVADLGLACTIEELSTAGPSGSTGRPMVRPGTIPYSPPEQRNGGSLDQRADQYAFCYALREALGAGGRRKIPRQVDAALRRGLSDDPAARWPEMPALLAELRRVPWWQHRAGWALAGATVFAIPGAFAFATAGPACPDARERLVGRWDPQIRAQIVDAFGVDGAEWSQRLLATVDGELEAYATRWAREMNAACVASMAEPSATAAAHLACLDRALERMGRTTAILADGRGSVVERADDLVRELTPLDRCRPTTRAPEAAPEGEVAEAIGEAERSQLWLAAGRVHDAREAAERAVVLAERTHDPAALAEAHLARGLVLDVAGHDEAALEDLQAAAAHGLATHDEDVSARAWQVLAFIAAYDLEDERRASEWLRLAEAAVIGLDNPAVLSADVHDVRGILEALRGDPAASERAHRAALAELQAKISDDDPRWAKSWTNLARIRLEQGDPAEARGLMERVLELRTWRLGPEHPDVAKALLGLALAERAQGETVDALGHLERAERIFESAFGPSSLRLAPVLTAIADLRIARKELDLAVAPAQRAWEIQKGTLPLQHSERVEGALLLLLQIAELQHDYKRFLALASVRRDEAVLRNDRLEIARIDNDIASTLCELGRWEEARPIYAALRVHESKDPQILAIAVAGMGVATLAAGEPRSAIPLLEQGLLELEALGEPDSDHLAEARFRLAEALAASGGAPDRVRALAIAALPNYRDTGTQEEIGKILELIEVNP